MSDPVPKIEIETFGGLWLDYSDRFKAAKTKRGRRRAMEKVNAGTMFITLANEDRGVDPEHAGTLVFPGQRIRLTADYLGNNYPIWQGKIDRIIQAYNAPNSANAILECTDALAILEQTSMESTYEASQKPIVKRVWYRFGEAEGATVANDSSGNNRHAAYGGIPTLETPPLMLFDADTAVEFSTGANGDYVLMPPNILPAALPFSINFLINMPAGGVFVPIMYSNRYPNGLTIWMDNTGKINVRIMTNGVVTAFSKTAAAFSGNTFQVSIQFRAGLPIAIFDHTGTDWTDYTTDIGTSVAVSGDDYHAFGYTTGGTFDEFFVVDYAFTAAEMNAINFGGNGWFPEGFTSRIARVLDSIGWSPTDAIYMIDDEVTEIIPAMLDGVSALHHLREIMDSIEGHMFVQADGKLRFLGRFQKAAHDYALSRGTFGDIPGELRYVAMDGSSLDTELVTNIVHREGHSQTTVATDPASIAKYGPRDNATEISRVRSLLLDPTTDYDLAQYRIAHYKEAIPVVDDLKLSPRTDPDNLWPQVLERELSERITLRRRPQNVGAVIEKEMIVEGIEHEIGPKKWIVTWHIDAINALRFFTFNNTLWDDPDWRFIA